MLFLLAVLCLLPDALWAEEPPGVAPLRSLRLSDIRTVLPPDIHVLIDPDAIEQFLEMLEGTPPDWAAVYGRGHHDPAHDERLYNLNRERDARREGNDALHWRIAFLWSGELSAYDPETGGFRVALGPRFTPTSWGVVRFKYEDLPGALIAIPSPDQRASLRKQVEQGQLREIDVVMIGRLAPEESLIYDFSHDQEGLGLIMPVVRVDEMFYRLPSDL